MKKSKQVKDWGGCVNKLDVINELIKLSKRSDYIMSTDGRSHRKYSYDSESLNYSVVEYGFYVDTRGGWLKYYTKDVAKHYTFNPVEMLLIKNLFI